MGWRPRRRIDPKVFWTWKSNRVSWCIRCHRTIEKGDVVRLEEFYDRKGPYHAVTHNDCREVRDRARLPAPEPAFVLIGGGELRRLIMDVKTTTPEEQQKQTTTKQRKSSAKKPAKGTAKASPKKAPKKSSKSDGSKDSRRPMVVTVAERLAPHFSGKKVPSALKAMTKGETPANSELIELRDAVKELAAKLREEGKKDEASALSATNALVRRLERATR